MTARCIKSKKFCEYKHDRGLVLLSTIIAFALLGMIFLYVFQTNGLVDCNFKIRKQQQKIEELKITTEKLEMNIAQWQSPVNLEELVDLLEMVEVGEVIYLTNEKEVAVKE